MPVISMFYGIIVLLFFHDNRRHKRPHFHVRYQGMEAVFSIPDGKMIEGALPTSKKRLVAAWIEIHRDELLADWNLVADGSLPFQIEPLK